MISQPLHRNHPRTNTAYSAFSRPYNDPTAAYEIHLIKSEDPNYIPADMEVWPIYHNLILLALRDFPEAHRAAVEAVKKAQQQLKGRENRDIPPGIVPRWQPQ